MYKINLVELDKTLCLNHHVRTIACIHYISVCTMRSLFNVSHACLSIIHQIPYPIIQQLYAVFYLSVIRIVPEVDHDVYMYVVPLDVPQRSSNNSVIEKYMTTLIMLIVSTNLWNPFIMIAVVDPSLHCSS